MKLSEEYLKGVPRKRPVASSIAWRGEERKNFGESQLRLALLSSIT